MKVYDNVLSLIGNTPLVRYNDNIYLKMETFNPSGSIKDRAGFNMLHSAILSGLINDDTQIIEPTSGNTGIALAMCCSVLGLNLTIVMPENMSDERKKLIKAYGANLVLTPKTDGMQGAVNKAQELASQNKNSFIPFQFSNPANPQAHTNTTTEELLSDTDSEVDIVVAGIGTSGTTIGIKQGFLDLKPEVEVYGVEPEESPLLTKGVAGPHKIQGIGANFVPEIYNLATLDGVLTVKSEDAINEARELAKTKGILAGISSGANLFAAKELHKKHPDKLIVTFICDSGERYLSTELWDK